MDETLANNFNALAVYNTTLYYSVLVFSCYFFE